MRITVENWKDVEREIKQSGIQDATYDEKGFLMAILTKRGVSYEVSPDVLLQLVESGLLEVNIGRRVGES